MRCFVSLRDFQHTFSISIKLQYNWRRLVARACGVEIVIEPRGSTCGGVLFTLLINAHFTNQPHRPPVASRGAAR